MKKTVSKPLILVTNDDGISSKGIRSLVEVAVNFGEVVVVAPDKAQSGMGHAITVNQILRLDKSDIFKEVEAFTCSGTPVDCVKLSISEVLHRRPDLILSGINHGENTSTNVLYSGTMSAAVEGAMENIPSIGFSLSDFNSDADFSGSQLIAKTIIEKVLSESMPEHVCLNVNVPKLPSAELKGFQICRQAHAFWEDRFDKRVDQFGRPYFWLTGDFVRKDADEGTDLHALKNGFASVVPTQFDMTAYKVMDQFKNWNK
jgi:5'-nucleotidase